MLQCEHSAIKLDFMHESGASEVIVLRDAIDAAKIIRQLSGGMGLDLTVDCSGDPKLHRLACP